MNKKRFGKVLAVWAVLLCVVFAAAAIGIHSAKQAAAEKPAAAMDELLASTPEAEWTEIAQQGLTASLSPYENAESVVAPFTEKYLTGCTYSWAQESVAADGSRTYSVYASGLRICHVTVSADGSQHEIMPCLTADGLASVTAVITIPAGEQVFINGVEADSNVLKETKAYDGLSEVEQRFTAVPACDIYEVGPLYGSIAVTLADGTELGAAGSAESGTLSYNEEPEVQSVKITAPEDVTVSLCGAELTESDASNVSPGVLEGFESFAGDSLVMTREYSFENLHTEPVVTAVDADGNVLEPEISWDGVYMFHHVNDAELEAAETETASRLITRYVTYACHKGGESALLNCIYTNSDLYYYVSTAGNGMSFSCPTKADYTVQEYTNFNYEGDNAFTCTAHFAANLTSTSWYETFSYSIDNTYRLLFVRGTSGNWRCAGMFAQ